MSRLVILAVLVMVPVGVGAQVSIDQAAPTVTVRVYRTSLGPSEFRAASALAGRVLEAAGIGVSWVQCWPGAQGQGSLSADCQRPLTRSDVIVHVIPASDTNSASHQESLGFAMIDVQAGAGTVASVYTDRVAMLAREAGVGGVDLLAWAMAHEIGHLLLGTSQHAVRGLMRERWSHVEVQQHLLRDWSFSVAEGQTMRNALRSRGMAQAARLAPRAIAN